MISLLILHMLNSPALLSSTYFGPVNWYAKFFQFKNIVIERHENYIRQSWRNRCRIIGPNGIQDLVVPVHARNHTPVQEVEIDYSENWQKRHWGTIKAAYGQSPFFDFYKDKIAEFFTEKKTGYLIEHNTFILQKIFLLLKLNMNFSFTGNFEENPRHIADLRAIISPKTKFQDENFIPIRYPQVFEERHVFVPGLSMLDLLFCCGPESKEILVKSLPGEKEKVIFGKRKTQHDD